MPKFWVCAEIYNQRQAIIETDVELEKLDYDDLNDFIFEIEEAEEIEWIEVPAAHRREIKNVENESGESFAVLILEGEIGYECPKCPTTLLVDLSTQSATQGRKCPKCSSEMTIEKNENTGVQTKFKLLKG